MDFFCVRRQCSRHNHFQFGNPERVTEIPPFRKVEKSPSAPLSFLFQWPEVSLGRLFPRVPNSGTYRGFLESYRKEAADVLSGVVIPT